MIMDEDPKYIVFESSNREGWLRTVSDVCNDQFHQFSNSKKCVIDFNRGIKTGELKPFHLVTLANLIHHLIQSGISTWISSNNSAVYSYIYNDLDFKQYWSGGKNHVNANMTREVLNLWRIVEGEKDLYAKRVENEEFINEFVL